MTVPEGPKTDDWLVLSVASKSQGLVRFPRRQRVQRMGKVRVQGASDGQKQGIGVSGGKRLGN
jgi:hypothetical protein